MKIILIITAVSLLSFAAYAQMQCQTLSDGRIICLPAGGGPSSYR